MDADADIQAIALAAITDGVPLLKAFRTHRGLGVDELAAAARVPAEDIARAEAGGALSFDYLASIAETLEIPVEMLLWHAAKAPETCAEVATEADA